jgi:hypothetical protein
MEYAAEGTEAPGESLATACRVGALTHRRAGQYPGSWNADEILRPQALVACRALRSQISVALRHWPSRAPAPALRGDSTNDARERHFEKTAHAPAGWGNP